MPSFLFISILFLCFVFKTINYSLSTANVINWIHLFIDTFRKFFENLQIPDTVLSARETKMKIHGSFSQEVYILDGKQIYPPVFVMTYYVDTQTAVGLHHR